jgi:Cu(I)/Ag(I) efflux system periplasmic protein CusF
MNIRSLFSWAVILPLGLSACAGVDSASAAPSAPAMGVDLGGSAKLVPVSVAASPASRVRTTGEGHERAPTAGVAQQFAHDGHPDTHATGVVNSVDPAQHKLNISHNPIPEIGWPAMTMDFPVAPSVDLKAIKPGSRVNFTIEKGANGMYEVRSVQPAGGAK